jgi:diaminohydroxyphosphoribosylaminopyrimidine deaminase/5-amino-6-(5-phosphoribosylamino)uracil reductase
MSVAGLGPGAGSGDERFMARALALAARGMGETNPNPMVGAVVVRAGRVVGEGFHARAGTDHAEVIALRRAGEAARGGTLYVTLEPCAHEGRTPPCAPLVAAAGLRRVVVAQRDPNPLVRGRGLAELRRAGLAVTLDVGRPQAELLNRRFNTRMRAGRPFLLLKAALTLDGRIATAGGDSKWITSAGQRKAARALRRLQDAVAVGVGTVLADDPLLLAQPRTARPFTRVVFDSRLRLPPDGRLARSTRSGPVVVLCAEAPARRRRALEKRGVSILRVDADRDGRVDLRAALAALGGFSSLMVEGGGELLGAFLAAGLMDEVALFRAPLLLGGRASRGAFGGPDPASIGEAIRLEPAVLTRQERALVGGDVEWWRPGGGR